MRDRRRGVWESESMFRSPCASSVSCHAQLIRSRQKTAAPSRVCGLRMPQHTSSGITAPRQGGTLGICGATHAGAYAARHDGPQVEQDVSHPAIAGAYSRTIRSLVVERPMDDSAEAGEAGRRDASRTSQSRPHPAKSANSSHAPAPHPTNPIANWLGHKIAYWIDFVMDFKQSARHNDA